MRRIIAAATAAALTAAALSATLLGGTASAAAPSLVKPVRTVSVTSAMTVETYQYAGNTDVDQSLDAYYDPGTTGRPWVIVLHGGSWAAGSKANSDASAKKFQAAGFAVFNVAYRLSTSYAGNPGAKWPAQRDDVVKAMYWIKANAAQFGINPDRGGIYGFSAGAHLAMSVATYVGSPALKAVVGASGPYQPIRLSQVASSDSATGYAGDKPTTENQILATWAAVLLDCPWLNTWTECSGRWDDASADKHLDANDPPIMLFQGTADPAVPPTTATSMDYWARQRGIESSLTECVGWTHTEACAMDGGWRQDQLMAFMKAKTA